MTKALMSKRRMGVAASAIHQAFMLPFMVRQA
jgi:hypothetical protein